MAFSHHPTHDPEGRTERRRSDDGGALIELAFAMPIVIVIMLGFVDLGFAVFQTSQATSAAADGARAGIVHWRSADVSGSPDNTTIQTAVKGKLVGQKVQSVDVRCVKPNGDTVTCASADPSLDRLRVDVAWTFKPISPVAGLIGPKQLTGTSTMALIDQPVGLPTTTTTSTTTTTTSTTTTTAPPTTTTTTTPSTTTTPPTTTTTTAPPACEITALGSTPGIVKRKNNGTLQDSLTMSATTNGSPLCTAISLRIVTNGSSTATITMTKSSASTWSGPIDKNAYNWSVGQKTATVYNGSVSLGLWTLYPLITVQS